MDIFHEHEHGVAFDLILQPRSSMVKLSGIQGNVLKLKVCSPPVDNKANQECQKYFSKIFSVPKSDVQIITGHKARRKRIFIRNVNADQANQVICEHLVD